ncbi:MAG: 5'/3'-nucleotidase SurE [Planctomycetaceae bacterium]|nr:5'/3'-nucleotidase SurE [Planctomycetaceae bacterium]
MQLLLTNDDGIDAPGLAALEEVASKYGSPVVVAPQEEHSGASHRVTDRQAIGVKTLSDTRHAVGGTPVDCARLGLLHLARETTWVLSGINAGGNLGIDIYMSGTVAAAREAALLGLPAIAISQFRRSWLEPLNLERMKQWTGRVLDELFQRPLERGEIWNVNFPDPEDPNHDPEIVFCPVGSGHFGLSCKETNEGFVYRGRYFDRHREPGDDVDVCFSGNIAVSKISHG